MRTACLPGCLPREIAWRDNARREVEPNLTSGAAPSSVVVDCDRDGRATAIEAARVELS